MRTLHAILAALAIAFFLIVVIANRECAPKYYQPGDVIAMLALSIVFVGMLLWASLSDSDARRGVGALSSAGLGALFIVTASFPMLVSPLAIVGALRLPRSKPSRWRLLALLPLVILVTIGLPYLGQSTMTADQFHCP